MGWENLEFMVVSCVELVFGLAFKNINKVTDEAQRPQCMTYIHKVYKYDILFSTSSYFKAKVKI